MDLLNLLYVSRRSISINVEETPQTLTLYPPVDKLTVERIRGHFKRFADHLPGVCECCDLWAPKRVIAYWADTPHICFTCVETLIGNFEETNRWPGVRVPSSLAE